MTYRLLAPQLHAVAEAVRDYCNSQWGVAKSKISVEEPVAPGLGLVPTLSMLTADYYHLCVEVSTRAYSNTLDAFVLDCKNRGLAIRLFVAIPRDGVEGDFKADIARARANGVGVLEIAPDSDVVVHADALALSLTGVRAIDTKLFPARYRHPLNEAARLFRTGSPSKACSAVYDEIEALTRKLVKKSAKNGWWKGKNAPTLNADDDPWANLTRILMSSFDRKAARAPDLREALFARVLGVTTHRNESGHKPNTLAKLQNRDAQLRTRFEGAVDLLRELIDATRPLKL